MTKNRLLDSIIRIFFGHWNGIQVFLVPTTLFYLLDGYGVANWVSGLLTLSIHYLPLTIFVMLFLFVGFLIIKRYSFDAPHLGVNKRRGELGDFIVSLHEQLLVFIIGIVLVFVLSSFMKYFYNINFKIKYALAYSAQIFCVILVIYNYVLEMWLLRYRQRGYGRNRAWAYLLVFIRHNMLTFVLYTTALIAVIILSVYAYKSLIFLFISPLIESIGALSGIKLNFIIHQSVSGWVIAANVWIIFVAFLCSNLIFAPVVNGLHSILWNFHPLRGISNTAQQNRNRSDI